MMGPHAADRPVANYLDSQYTQLLFSLLLHNDFVKGFVT